MAPWDSSWAYVIVNMFGNIVCEAVLSVQGPLLYSLYGGDLRVVLGAARCEEVDRDKILSCPVSTSKKNAPGRLFYQERYTFELWHVCQALGSQRLADHALGVFDE